MTNIDLEPRTIRYGGIVDTKVRPSEITVGTKEVIYPDTAQYEGRTDQQPIRGNNEQPLGEEGEQLVTAVTVSSLKYVYADPEVVKALHEMGALSTIPACAAKHHNNGEYSLVGRIRERKVPVVMRFNQSFRLTQVERRTPKGTVTRQSILQS